MILTVNDRWYIDPAFKVGCWVVVKKQNRPAAEACEKEKNRAGNLTTDAMQRQCHEISTRVLGGGSYYTHMYRLLQAACRSPSTGKWGTYRGVGQDHSHLRETHEQKTHAFSQKR